MNLTTRIRNFSSQSTPLVPFFAHTLKNTILVYFSRLFQSIVVIIDRRPVFYACFVSDFLPWLAVLVKTGKRSFQKTIAVKRLDCKFTIWMVRHGPALFNICSFLNGINPSNISRRIKSPNRVQRYFSSHRPHYIKQNKKTDEKTMIHRAKM